VTSVDAILNHLPANFNTFFFSIKSAAVEGALSLTLQQHRTPQYAAQTSNFTLAPCLQYVKVI
jgi:hypothetical protein